MGGNETLPQPPIFGSFLTQDEVVSRLSKLEEMQMRQVNFENLLLKMQDQYNDMRKQQQKYD